MIFGTNEQFRKSFSNPILRGREPDASDTHKEKGQRCVRTHRTYNTSRTMIIDDMRHAQ